MGKDRYKFTPNQAGTRTNDEYKKLRCSITDRSRPDLSKVQYTRRNAVQSLMLACSLIYFVDERAGREAEAA